MAETRDFSSVTEGAATRATREQLKMIRTRYALAAEAATGRRVLEVACGTGRGMGWLRRVAATAVGGDITTGLLAEARAHFQSRVPFVRFDAQRLPFCDGSFDVVVMFEAIYYLQDPQAFLRECTRVLSPGGRVLLCSANREWDGFTPSPFAHRFYSADELRDMLERNGFSAEIRAGFPVSAGGLRSTIIRTVRRIAVQLGVIPKTLGGREWLKRMFYGELAPLGPEVEERGDTETLVEVRAGHVSTHKVLYAWGQRSNNTL